MADHALTGRRVLAIVSPYGVEQDELLVPVRHLRHSGADVDVAADTADPVQTLVADKYPGESVQPTLTLAQADPAAYDLLLVPGGTLNADTLHLQETALDLVRAFAASGRTVAAICHGPLTVVEAAVISGKTLTAYPSLASDIHNSGGRWVDEAVVSDESGGWVLITSQTPDDLPQFCLRIDAALTAAPA